MSFGTADLSSLWAIKEVTWGVTPGSGNLKGLRLLSESLNANLETKSSEEIRADRATADLVPVGQSAGGGFGFEMSFGSFDDLIAGALFSSFSADVAIVGVAGDISTVNATGKITSTTAGKFTDLELGQSFRLKGFSNGGGENNLIYKIVTYTSDQDITVVPVPPSDETPAGVAAEIHSESVKNGVTQSSFSIERRIPDATVPEFFQFEGSVLQSMTMDFEVGDILKGAFEFLCKDGDSTTTAYTGLTDVPVPTSDIYNSVNNLSNIYIDGVLSTQQFMKLGMSIGNNLRSQKAIGSLPAIGIGAGFIDITGPIEIYFQDGAEFTKFKANTAFSLSFSLEDASGNAYVFSFPKVKYENLVANAEGRSSDIIAKGNWRAIIDPAESIMIRIDKLDSSL